jgi:hypothetical protein
VRTYDDFEAGTKFPKLNRSRIWIVEITIPRKLMSTIEVGSLELEGQNLDLSELDSAYDEDLDDEQTQSSEQPAQQPAAPVAPGGFPGV